MVRTTSEEEKKNCQGSIVYEEDIGLRDINPLALDDLLLDFGKPWYFVPNIVLLNVAITFIIITSSNTGYDGSVLNGFQSLESWQSHMGHPQGQKLGVLVTGYTFGAIAGSLIASWISDSLGRTYGILIGEAITILGAILQGVSTNYAFFFVTRIVLGFGSTIAGTAALVLIAEIAYPTHRGALCSSYAVFWYVGALIASGVTYGTRNISSSYSWRIPSYVQGALPLVQCIGWFTMPESPRFLISKGKMENAEKFFRKYHAGGSDSLEATALVNFELAQCETAIELEKIQNRSSYMDFFKTKGNRKRLIIDIYLAVMQNLSGNSLMSYYLNLVLNSIGIKSTDEQLKINIGLMAFNTVASFFAAWATYKLRRRVQFMISRCSMLACFVVWTVVSAVNQEKHFEDKPLAKTVLAMIFLFYLAYDFGSCTYPYLTEVMSFSLRSKGMNVNIMFNNLFSLYTGFADPVAMKAIDWKYYTVYLSLLVVGIPFLYFYFPETAGRSLEEIGAIFADDPEEESKFVTVKSTQAAQNILVS